MFLFQIVCFIAFNFAKLDYGFYFLHNCSFIQSSRDVKLSLKEALLEKNYQMHSCRFSGFSCEKKVKCFIATKTLRIYSFSKKVEARAAYVDRNHTNTQ